MTYDEYRSKNKNNSAKTEAMLSSALSGLSKYYEGAEPENAYGDVAAGRDRNTANAATGSAVGTGVGAGIGAAVGGPGGAMVGGQLGGMAGQAAGSQWYDAVEKPWKEGGLDDKAAILAAPFTMGGSLLYSPIKKKLKDQWGGLGNIKDMGSRLNPFD
jgi:hypothetical protein